MNDLININDESNNWIKLGNIKEPAIMIACIKNVRFLFDIEDYVRCIQSPYIRSICQWCVDFYKKHGQAPGEEVKGIYEDESIDEVLRSLYKILIETHLQKSKEVKDFKEVKTYLIEAHRFWTETERNEDANNN